MKKLILKTTAITLASIILVTSITFGIFVLFFPASLAKMFKSLGGESVAIYYYEKQYEKTDDINDLYTLCIESFNNKDYERAELYFTILIQKEGFNRICVIKDAERNNSVISTKEICHGALARATYETKGLDRALSVSRALINAYGYSEYSPYLFLLENYGKKFIKVQLEDIERFIQQSLEEITDSAQKVFAEQDLAKVEQLLNALNG